MVLKNWLFGGYSASLTSSATALMWYGSIPQHPPMYLMPMLYASLAYLCMSHLVTILGSSAEWKKNNLGFESSLTSLRAYLFRSYISDSF